MSQINECNIVLSVIMPVYNGEKFLKQAIDSILEQDFSDFEFIIINDGSTDTSEQIILSYDDSRIRYVRNDSNIRLIKTLNKGIDLARGKYIARMDADDISTRDRLSKQVNILDASSNIHIVSSTAYNILDDGSVFAPPTKWYSSGAIKIISPLANLVCHPTIMCRSEVLKNNKYKDKEDYVHIEDAELWIRLLEKGYNFYMIKEPLLYYRQNPSGVSINNRIVQAKKYINISKKVLSEKYKIEVNSDLLFLLNFEFVNYRNGNFFEVEKKITEYFEISISGHSDKNTLRKELNNWLQYTLISSSLKGFIMLKGCNGISALYYLLCRLKWLRTYYNVVNRYFYKLKQ